MVTRPGVAGFQIRLLAPRRPTAGEDVCRAGTAGAIIGRAVHPRRAAVFASSPNDHGISRHRHRDTEGVTLSGVVGFQIRLLAPRRPTAGEDVGRAGSIGAVVGSAVHPRRAAVLYICPDDNRVAVHRH